MLIELILLVMCAIVILLSLLLIVTLRNGSDAGEDVVTVLVVGDIGRSPRMQYHSVSFAKRGYQVQHVGYKGSKPHHDLLSNRNIKIFEVRETPEFHQYVPKLIAYGLKVLWQSVFLMWTLCQTRKSSHLLLQTPPAIPTLSIAWLFCLFRCTRMLIDWHNYGFTILALTTGHRHPLVRFSRWFEQFFGQLAFWGFCVTEAMQIDLRKNWNIIRTDVLYDRPSDRFKPITVDARHDLFVRLAKDIPLFRASSGDFGSGETAFTTKDSAGVISLRQNRPVLIVSSTSWTEDEDFSILLEALQVYSSLLRTNSGCLPPLICAITGKGPLKEHYIKLIASRKWSGVSICTPWLEPEDYPLLLASADLGVCLHKSSSGLDLPMKVVDMFGSGLPVCAVDFLCLPELVKHNENGLIFQDAEELTSQLTTLLTGFPDRTEKLDALRANLKNFHELSWEKNWEQVVLPIMGR